jgi:hypothetical protein
VTQVATGVEFALARTRFHTALRAKVLVRTAKGIASNADASSTASTAIAGALLNILGSETSAEKLAGQTAGSAFEQLTTDFLRETFLKLEHLRPGDWDVKCVGTHNRAEIARYSQYSHLIALQLAARRDPALAAALGSDYTITPDIVVSRKPVPDETINLRAQLVDMEVARRTVLREMNNQEPLLHASVSCKWTIRSDRAQNTRAEALNLIRNRKGRLPHIVAVTGEPLPSRIASLALGTGDIDCVYHFALPELQEAVAALGFADAQDLLAIMAEGQRLRDISDLPLDLSV